MESRIIVALVVLVAIAAHVAVYRWVKFKVHEGVILRFLLDEKVDGASRHHHADAIAVHTGISATRVAVICRKSVEVQSDPEVENSWRAG